MTIRSIQSFVRSIVDWSALDGCYSGRISDTDIDGVAERYGYCSFKEHKIEPGYLSDGQGIMFRALARQGNTVFTFWTEPPTEFREEVVQVPVSPIAVTRLVVHHPVGPLCHECGRPMASDVREVRPATTADFRREVAEWFQRQERRGRF